MSMDSFFDLDKILHRSIYVDSSPDLDKISTCDTIFRKKAMSSRNGNVFRNGGRGFRFKIRFGPF